MAFIFSHMKPNHHLDYNVKGQEHNSIFIFSSFSDRFLCLFVVVFDCLLLIIIILLLQNLTEPLCCVAFAETRLPVSIMAFIPVKVAR